MTDVFLSHSSKDKQFARRLASDLRIRGVNVWIDEAELKVGDSLIEKIQFAVEKMKYLAVVLSPDSVKSEWVKKELEIALTTEITAKQVKVLPILLKECEIPGFLRGKIYVDMTTPAKYKNNLDHLVRRITGEVYASQNEVNVDEAFAQKYVSSLTEGSKEAHKYVFDNLLSRGATAFHFFWSKGELYIRMDVPHFRHMSQEEDVGGLVFSPENAVIIFTRKIDKYTDSLYLTPTGKRIHELLRK